MSPFLFSIWMIVLLYDCRRALPDTDGLRELLYADDTLLMGARACDIQLYMDTIATEGKKYGLMLNYDKLELLRIHTEEDIYDPDGAKIACKASIKYLGAQISASGHIYAELWARIGMAKQKLLALERIFKYSNIP